MANEKIEAFQMKVGESFTMKERKVGKILFNVHNIKATTCKTPTKSTENDALFGYGSKWKLLDIENDIVHLQEIGTQLKRSMKRTSLEHLLKNNE
jgi:hypothetical protein